MTTFESPVISLEDQALALEASAEAFNARGGANGACIEVTTCDDGANVDQALECVRTLDDAGVVATVNDQGLAGQDEVSAAMREAGIPRVAGNVTQLDWTDRTPIPWTPPAPASPSSCPRRSSTRTPPRSVWSGSTNPRPERSRACSSPSTRAMPPSRTTPPSRRARRTTTSSSWPRRKRTPPASRSALGEQEAVQIVRAGKQTANRP